MFHVLQAGARAEGRPIPAKGLSGNGYDGHTFWDSETFVLPFLTYTIPDAAAHVLRWRHSTLPGATERASQLGLRGATFPWRTIDGAECSAYWPAGTAAFHVNADIAAAVTRYVDATGDDQFDAATGLDLLVQTARLWLSVGHHDAAGKFRIDGVTGPDEYSAIADNNVFTNLMAQHNLRAAASSSVAHPDRARELGVSAEEVAKWQAAADQMLVPYDEKLGVHPQAEGFTNHQVWDFSGTRPDQYPLLAHFPYFDLYRKQVVKQADLVLAMQTCPDGFTAEQKARNFVYYEALTVRDSSLSACTQAVIAAETGHLELAYDYLAETALMDLSDLEHNTKDGVHLAALAGAWIALVTGFGGMRNRHGQLPSFAPRLPPALTRLTFTVYLRGAPPARVGAAGQGQLPGGRRRVAAGGHASRGAAHRVRRSAGTADPDAAHSAAAIPAKGPGTGPPAAAAGPAGRWAGASSRSRPDGLASYLSGPGGRHPLVTRPAVGSGGSGAWNCRGSRRFRAFPAFAGGRARGEGVFGACARAR